MVVAERCEARCSTRSRPSAPRRSPKSTSSSVGIVSDDYSFTYLAHWSNGDTDLIRTTTERVITCARRILANKAQHAVDHLSDQADRASNIEHAEQRTA